MTSLEEVSDGAPNTRTSPELRLNKPAGNQTLKSVERDVRWSAAIGNITRGDGAKDTTRRFTTDNNQNAVTITKHKRGENSVKIQNRLQDLHHTP
ncbi:MAG: hypothetical protein OXI63_20075 [Candidatus Poribacteria bacterium]|nr:hypothetical protein [Candidatus Poribacteria bacterium]